jgi:hypothetical protein
MIRRATLIAFAIAIAGGLMAATTGGASAAVPSAACTTSSAVIEIESFAFNPASIPPGGMSTATLTALNCTGQPQVITELWYGRFTGPGAGIPPGCPAIDPLVMSAALLPHGTVSSHIAYLVPASCTASQLVITVDISGPSGGMLAQGTAVLTINQSSTNPGS